MFTACLYLRRKDPFESRIFSVCGYWCATENARAILGIVGTRKWVIDQPKTTRLSLERIIWLHFSTQGTCVIKQLDKQYKRSSVHTFAREGVSR